MKNRILALFALCTLPALAVADAAAAVRDDAAPAATASETGARGRYARLINDPVMRGLLSGMKRKYSLPYCWIPEAHEVKWECEPLGWCATRYTVSCHIPTDHGPVVQSAWIHAEDDTESHRIFGIEFATAVP